MTQGISGRGPHKRKQCQMIIMSLPFNSHPPSGKLPSTSRFFFSNNYWSFKSSQLPIVISLSHIFLQWFAIDSLSKEVVLFSRSQPWIRLTLLIKWFPLELKKLGKFHEASSHSLHLDNFLKSLFLIFSLTTSSEASFMSPRYSDLIIGMYRLRRTSLKASTWKTVKTVARMGWNSAELNWKR